MDLASSVAASRAEWVTIKKPQPVRFTRSRASARTSWRWPRQDCRWARRRAAAAVYRERAADRDPLLLAAGQLLGIASQQTAEPEPFHQFGMPGGIVTAGNARLEDEVVLDIQARDQVELLKHQTQLVPAQGRAAGIGEIGEGRAGKPDLAAVGAIKAGDQMRQVLLPLPDSPKARHARPPRYRD